MRQPEMLLLYCLLKTPDELPVLKGLGDSALQYLSRDGLTVAYSEVSNIDLVSIESTTEHPAFQYERIVMTLHQQHHLIPIRFGEKVTGVEKIESLLNTHAPKIHQALNQLGDKSELIFKVRPTTLPEKKLPESLKDSKNKGIAYLRKKYQKHQQTFAAEDDLSVVEKVFLSVFQSVLFDHQVALKSDSVAVRLLVARSYQTSESITKQLGEQLPNHELSFTGAFPPYHFATLQLGKP